MNNWEEKRIFELGKVVTGKTPSKTEENYWNGNELFVSPKDMKRDSFYIDDTKSKISSLALQKFKSQIIPRNSVMYTALSFGFGKIGIASKDLITNQQINSIIVNSENNFKFIYYLLRVNTPYIFSYNSGIDTPFVPKSVFEKIKLLVPPLQIQEKIAGILSSYDELIENNNRRIELLEKASQDLYKEWFVRFRFPGYKQAKFKNGIPQGWSVFKFGEKVNIIDGDRGKNYPNQGDFKNDGHCLFLNTGNVTKCGFDFSNNIFISKEKDNKLRNGKLKYRDVVITTRGTVGNVALYNEVIKYENIRINSGMVIIREKFEDTPAEFIYALLKSSSMKSAIIAYSSGSAQPQLPIKDMRKIKFILPTINLVNSFSRKIDKINLMISNLQTQNLNLIKQRDLLLPRLMSGKLRV